MVNLDTLDQGPRGILSKLGHNPKFNGVTGLLIVVLSMVLTPACAVVFWGVNSIFTAQKETSAAIGDMQIFLRGAEERAKQRDFRIANLEANDKTQASAQTDYQHGVAVILQDHGNRILTLEQAAIAEQQAHIKVLEEPEVTRALNRRQAVKR